MLRANDALIIEGVAETTHPYLFEFALGLKRLDGSTSVMRKGPDPRKFQAKLPLPLLWAHEPDKRIGELIAVNPTDTRLYFKAVIVPPGTAGYNGDLLFKVWDDVRSGAAPAVSIAAPKRLRKDEGWTITELSVCREGRNPYAVITKATFPDGHVVTRPVPAEDEPINSKNDVDMPAKRAAATLHPTAIETRTSAPVPAVYMGTWKADATYQRGHMVTDKGVLWHCESDNLTGRPRDTRGWKLMHKSLESDRR
ncbi:MAG: hypothetical protein ACR2L2_07000 [Acidobacteriota bacterium]